MKLKQKVAITDIARKVGKDVSTVSLALRDSPKLPKKTKQAILKTARELGYRPNVLAQAIRGAKTNSIGVVVHNIANEHLVETLEGIEDVALKVNNIVLMQISQNDPDREKQIVYSLLDRSADGLLIEPTVGNEELYFELIEQNIPFVFIILSNDKVSVDCVISDDRYGSLLAVEHLYDLGHRKIAYIGATPYNELVLTSERLMRKEGYEFAIKKLGLPLIVYTSQNYTIENGYKLTNQILQDHPNITAIYSASETMAVGAMRCIYDKGLKIPDDISLVGFEGGLRGESMYPPLTTIKGNMREIGTKSAELLFEQINSKDKKEKPTHTIMVKPKLILRSSTKKLVHPNNKGD